MQVIRDLAARADVVVENFSPGVVDRLGVGYDDLLAVNPRLVYVSMSAYGATGPQAHFIGYGTHMYAASGAGFATSRDGETISQMWIPLPDPISGLAGAYAIAAYAGGARRSGRPAYVDLSELESMCCIALEPMLAAGSPEPPAPGTESGLADYRVVSSADDRLVALIVPGRDRGAPSRRRSARRPRPMRRCARLRRNSTSGPSPIARAPPAPSSRPSRTAPTA